MSVILAVLAHRIASAQFETGEVRGSVVDTTGLPLPSSVTLVSQSSQIRRASETNEVGQFTFQHLPFGVYHLTIEHAGFTPFSTVVEIRTEVPHEIQVQLHIKGQSTEVVVTDEATLIDPHRTGVT